MFVYVYLRYTLTDMDLFDRFNTQQKIQDFQYKIIKKTHVKIIGC